MLELKYMTWRELTEYWFGRFKRAYLGRRKWRRLTNRIVTRHSEERSRYQKSYSQLTKAFNRKAREARKWRRYHRQAYEAYQWQSHLKWKYIKLFEDADLKRIGWKFLTTVLLGIIAILLLK